MRATTTLLAALVAVSAAAAQQPRSLTAADYDRAVKLLGPAVTPLVSGGTVVANWLPDDRFWYRNTTASGATETVLVDPAKRTRVVCDAQRTNCTGVPSEADAAAINVTYKVACRGIRATDAGSLSSAHTVAVGG